MFGDTSDARTLLLQTCQAVLGAPQKCHQKCVLLPLPAPAPQQAAGDEASPVSQWDPSHLFFHAGKTGSRTFLASSEWLPALSNVLPCLCLQLVLRQEYLSARLAVLPVFKLSLVMSDYMCLCKGGSYYLASMALFPFLTIHLLLGKKPRDLPPAFAYCEK